MRTNNKTYGMFYFYIFIFILRGFLYSDPYFQASQFPYLNGNPPYQHYGMLLKVLRKIWRIAQSSECAIEFTAEHPEYISQDNAMGFLSNDGGESYNLCHCTRIFRRCRASPLTLNCLPTVWSNFEIADLDFWRSEAYQKFFDYLESKGGFYYEVSEPITSSASLLSHLSQRWGDAPIHSIAAGLFANKDQLHFFRDIGYKHEFFQHCPSGKEWEKGKCSCDPNDNFGPS